MNTKIDMQLPLVGLEEKPLPSPSQPPPEGMAVSVEDPEKMRQRERHRKWRMKNRDRWNNYSKQYYERHHESILEKRHSPEGKLKISKRNRIYRSNHLEEHKQTCRDWYYAHKDSEERLRKCREANRRYYARHRELEIKRKTLYAQNNREKVRARFRRLRRTSIQFALKDRLRATMSRALRRQWVKKSKRTMELVGCSVEELKAHLERQFVDGMSWETRRTWHVDHVVPLAFFDLRSVEEQKVAFNWRNLQPMFGRDNQRKNDTVPNPLPDWMPEYMKKPRE